MLNPSPLRYPGGKSKFYPIVKEILQLNRMSNCNYIEPFAGGAGLALLLLYSGDVKRIVINDLDPHIYAFWKAVLEYNDAFCRLIEQTPVTMKEWYIQKSCYNACDTSDILKLGFATFFLNRTNVSGVLTAGVIGGKEQKGTYKINARYNKPLLIQKIRNVFLHKENILLFNDDGFQLFNRPEIKKLKKTFINFDPPYVEKGGLLYKNSFCENDHIELAKKVLSCSRKWIVTYDAVPLIAQIYQKCRIGTWDVTYATSQKQNVQEYIIFKNGISIPQAITLFDRSSNNDLKKQ